jgi:deoxyadenosine/deoxycytidine kinase
MGKLVAVVGITGAGKTTLVRALCRKKDFALGLEQHEERPFQNLFQADSRFALANQVDYLLQRAKQESQLRKSPQVALVDGGLDLDFYGFTRLFFSRGLLNEKEYLLCQDLYLYLRSYLPQPDLIIRLLAEHDIVSQRLSSRARINIARIEDLTLLDQFINEWAMSVDPDIILNVGIYNDDRDYSKTIPLILNKMSALNI